MTPSIVGDDLDEPPTIRFDGRVAIVTGSGAGLGRAHALGLAARGARVVVNDLSGGAEAVVEQIKATGGEAVADATDVSDFAQVEAMVARARAAWGRVDILVNNAGILRDRTLAKMELSDFHAVLDVHLLGAVHGCKAVWELMRAQGYGRIVLTTSSSGLYGNFGQTNYGAAKAALIGLMHSLQHEGQRHGIRVNALAPTAATRMTENLVPEDWSALMAPEATTPGVLFLSSEVAPAATILCAGAGAFAVARVVETSGIYLPEDERTPEAVAARFAEITSMDGAETLPNAFAQTEKFVTMASKARAPSSRA